MTASHAYAYDGRIEPRDETLHRVVARDAEGQAHRLVVVNLSPHGLMARTECDLASGTSLAVVLPLVGQFQVTVRWSLSGRIGCLLDREIPAALYPAALLAMRG